VTSTSNPQVGRLSRRVALSATGLVAALYLAVAAAILAWLTVSLTAQVDERLQRALAFEAFLSDAGDELPDGAGRLPPPGQRELEGLPLDQPGTPPGLPFGRERVTWRIDADGEVSNERADLELPARYVAATGPLTIEIDGTQIRIAGAASEEGHVIVGESMEPVNDATRTVILGLLLIAPVLLLSVFFGSLAVGRRVAMPIERAWQRQLAFTADASHELRTPLSVIEANASLALAADRDVSWYRRSFERVLDESHRMRRLTEDLLWLARFDTMQQPPAGEPVDLGILAEQAVDRFAMLAETRSQTLVAEVFDTGVTLSAPPEWIDQLMGVLLDNACKYSPEHGDIAIRITASGGRATLTVDDSGPGIEEERRERVFDRFHRESSAATGAGLGLAIADVIVRATSGRWHISTSPFGGARIAVSWAIGARDRERPAH
jgi:signal transduction histidine kinase